MKKCLGCGKLKRITSFSETLKSCKSCRKYRLKYYQINRENIRKKAREHYHKNRKVIRKKWKEYYRLNSHKVRNTDLKREFGITLEDYDRILTRQGGRCAICGILNDNKSPKFHLDHCHNTKKIRGILCRNCNFLLGNAKDSQQILTKAIEYLNNCK